MEIRKTKVMIQKAGGTAGCTSARHRINIPAAWARDMALSRDTPDVEMLYQDGEIVLRKRKTVSELLNRAAHLGHQVKRYDYYNGQALCTTIYADFSSHEVSIENHTGDLIHRAFGCMKGPSWSDFMAFLEERCVPGTRRGLQYILEAAGLEEYDPVKLVEVSEGRMAEDHQWLSISEV